jgi:Tfp pilus assembly protein PilV
MRATACRPASRLRRRLGFSLIELLVAVILIDVALLAIVQTTAVVVRRRNETRARSAAVSAAASRIEGLLASPCAAASGAASLASIAEAWSLQTLGQTREATDSVSFGALAAHTLVLRTRLPC